jgi:hypothetical protein
MCLQLTKERATLGNLGIDSVHTGSLNLMSKARKNEAALLTRVRRWFALSQTTTNVQLNTEELDIPVPDIDGGTLEMLVQWMKYHHNDPTPVKKELRQQDDTDCGEIGTLAAASFGHLKGTHRVSGIRSYNYHLRFCYTFLVRPA